MLIFHVIFTCLSLAVPSMWANSEVSRAEGNGGGEGGSVFCVTQTHKTL